ncbi:unnamed protein product [Mytilus coruscus]|uniref:B box-type domain-containing protein n=1 Tax=Mytilus coruscus TaxID=42192 RepID=A0A6J8CLP5_MYTCO|nr:unnamed protein product [Mytilus coruscus]
MASSTHICSVCDLRNITKQSITWCTECDEGLCFECQEHHSLSKGTRKHNTISITEYQKLPSGTLQLTQKCDKHYEKYTIYCKKHECPCCSSCIVENHSDCQDLAKLAEIVKNIRLSNVLYEIENSCAELVDDIKKIQHSVQYSLKTLSGEKLKILEEIKQTRITINKHLDKIQEDTLKTIQETEEKEHKNISEILALLKEKENEIFECQRNMEKVKENATDLQTFLSIKQLEKEVSKKEHFLRSLIESGTFKESNLSYQVNTAILKIIADIESFGKVHIKTKPFDVVLTRKKDKQAQSMVPRELSRSIKNINLKLQNIIITMGGKTWGCCMLPDGRTAFTDCDCVRVFNTDGSKDFEVATPTSACDIAYISVDNTLAVTSGSSGIKCITIIDIQNKKIKDKIDVDSYYYGIAVKGTTFICSTSRKGIRLVYPYNNSISYLVRQEIPRFCYVAIFGYKMYHTNNRSNSVTCYDLQGTCRVQWLFKNESVLKIPSGISVDNDGNVYVIGNSSKNVVVISANGQEYKEILNARDGLQDATGLHYNRNTNQLLVANHKQKAMIFTLI